MSIQKIIQESINSNPLEMKEALAEELRNRVAEALAAKMEEVELEENFKEGDKVSFTTDYGTKQKGVITNPHTRTVKGKRHAEVRVGISPNTWSRVHVPHHRLEKVSEEFEINEAEQIDEISKDTVRSYADKSFRQANTLLKHSLSDQPKSVEKASKAAFKRRQSGIKAAGRRLGSDEMQAIHKNAMEEVELDEISKKTLGSYVTKAALSSTLAGNTMGSSKDDKEKSAAARKIGKRLSGIHQASKRLAKEDFDLSDFTIEELESFIMSEEFEQLDELDKKTLASYVKKAAGVAHRNTLPNAMRDRMTAASIGDKEWYKQSGRVADNRSKGIQRAADKLSK